jgi:hypothetical protein
MWTPILATTPSPSGQPQPRTETASRRLLLTQSGYAPMPDGVLRFVPGLPLIRLSGATASDCWCRRNAATRAPAANVARSGATGHRAAATASGVYVQVACERAVVAGD